MSHSQPASPFSVVLAAVPNPATPLQLLAAAGCYLQAAIIVIEVPVRVEAQRARAASMRTRLRQGEALRSDTAAHADAIDDDATFTEAHPITATLGEALPRNWPWPARPHAWQPRNSVSENVAIAQALAGRAAVLAEEDAARGG